MGVAQGHSASQECALAVLAVRISGLDSLDPTPCLKVVLV